MRRKEETRQCMGKDEKNNRKKREMEKRERRKIEESEIKYNG